MTATAQPARVRQPHAALRDPLRRGHGDDRARLAAADARGRRPLRPSGGAAAVPRRRTGRSATTASCGSIPTSRSSRSRSRRRASSCAPATPQRSVTIGGDHMVFTNVAGPPFVYEDGVRRDATIGRLRALRQARARLSDEIDSQGGLPCEPVGPPVRLAPPRHAGRGAHALGQAAHGRAVRGLEGARRPRAGGDRLRRPRSSSSAGPSPTASRT